MYEQNRNICNEIETLKKKAKGSSEAENYNNWNEICTRETN